MKINKCLDKDPENDCFGTVTAHLLKNVEKIEKMHCILR